MADPDAVARSRAHLPGSGVIDARTLATDQRHLATLLRPGLSVLDVGCGSGSITRGIAAAVGSAGRVVGVDADASLLALAGAADGPPHLSYQLADAYQLPFTNDFDIVTSARMLQWLAEPASALTQLVRAVKPGGLVVALDYNHEQASWEPTPPASFRDWYAAFGAWRAAAGFDQQIADHFGALFVTAGLIDILVVPQFEDFARGDAGFETALEIWAKTIEIRGPQMVRDGFFTEAERHAALVDYRDWAANEAQRQFLYLLAVQGAKPA